MSIAGKITYPQIAYRAGLDSLQTLKLIERCSNAAEVAALAARPVSAAGKLLGLDRLEQLAEGVCELGELQRSATHVARWAIGATANQKSQLVHSLWVSAPTIARTHWGDSIYSWNNVFGVPVVCDQYAESYWFASPENETQIIQRMRALGRSWIVNHDSVFPDPRDVPDIMSKQTAGIVDRLRLFSTPRAQLLWGPPGGGKSVAARQILRETCKMSVTLTPRASASDQIWRAIAVLKPEGILIDDIDSVADLDALLSFLESAREYAKIIVSTANTIKELRGALKRPGRASDDTPAYYGAPDSETAQIIAPSCDSAVWASQLPAAYLAELEARRCAGIAVADADIAELRKRAKDAGDR